jgi:phenol hydroxylase P5 protein
MGFLVTDDQRIEVPDGDECKEAAEELGIPFGCEDGICGTCDVEILEGMANLSDVTEAEVDMELDEGHRLMCQCKMKGGDVKIKLEW